MKFGVLNPRIFTAEELVKQLFLFARPAPVSPTPCLRVSVVKIPAFFQIRVFRVIRGFTLHVSACRFPIFPSPRLRLRRTLRREPRPSPGRASHLKVCRQICPTTVQNAMAPSPPRFSGGEGRGTAIDLSPHSEVAVGSAPAPGAVFRALAENLVRTDSTQPAQNRPLTAIPFLKSMAVEGRGEVALI